MAKKTSSPYYLKFRWMVSVTQLPNFPFYAQYGGKGIQCHWDKTEFREFEHWLINTLGHQPSPDHQLCRINKYADWAPGNLAWMIPKERSNSYTHQNVYTTYRKQKKTLAQWARDLDIPYWTLRRRIERGLTIKDVVKEFH